MSATPANAITVRIGDVDSFGFPLTGNPSVQTYQNPNNAGLADANGDGFLTAGDTLPDLNNNNKLATGQGDDFDNRSAAEAADLYAKWTDVALSTSFSGRPGRANDVFFKFTFAVPNVGDFDYGVDHFLNVIAGDLDVNPFSIRIDGALTVPLVGVGNQDGLITLTNATIPWSYLTDGELTVQFLAANEPFVAIDYVLLDTEVREEPTIPEPATLLLTMLGLGGAASLRRRRV
jgi:hypothetical protein